MRSVTPDLNVLNVFLFLSDTIGDTRENCDASREDWTRNSSVLFIVARRTIRWADAFSEDREKFLWISASLRGMFSMSTFRSVESMCSDAFKRKKFL